MQRKTTQHIVIARHEAILEKQLLAQIASYLAMTNSARTKYAMTKYAMTNNAWHEAILIKQLLAQIASYLAMTNRTMTNRAMTNRAMMNRAMTNWKLTFTSRFHADFLKLPLNITDF